MNIFFAFANQDRDVRDKLLRQMNLVKDRMGWNQTTSPHIIDAYQSFSSFTQGEMAREARYGIKVLKMQYVAPFPWGPYVAFGGRTLALVFLLLMGLKMFGGKNAGSRHFTTYETATSTDPFAFNYPLVRVVGGTFQMGSPANEIGRDKDECQHEVSVKAFNIGKYEVTQAQWRAVMGNNPSYNKNCNDCPVENVSWNDIQSFIKKLKKKTGKAYRLPTEVEWEYAAKGGNKSHEYPYSGSTYLYSVAWFNENAGSKTHPVGGKAPNELDLYDMSGNVAEWCADTWKQYPCDNKTRVEGLLRVHRGGGWYAVPPSCRAANRSSDSPDDRWNFIGFRLVLSRK